MSPALKAALATLLFSGVGLITVLFYIPLTAVALPNAIFYVVLTINSYFSIKLYASIQPTDAAQRFFDSLLVVIYLALAFAIGHAAVFSSFALLVFVVATPKYALMLGKIPYGPLLRRKILIDLSGVTFTAAVFLGTLAGFPLESAWFLAIGFALANIYHLIIHPMYRL